MSCSNLGVLLVDDNLDVPADPARAAQLFRTACEGEPSACVNLGAMLKRGNGVPKDDAGAKALFQKACDQDFAEGCTELALLAPEADAPPLLDKACRGGSARACNHLGEAKLFGTGVPRDPGGAAQLFEAACKKQHPDACANVAYGRLEADPPDTVAAAELFGAACEAGSGQACLGLGGMALKGTSPITQDPKMALGLFIRACDRGVAAGCHNAGLIYQKALVPQPSNDSPEARFTRACKLGHEGACRALRAP